MHEDRYLYEVIALCRIFDLEPSQIAVGKTGTFKCPYCNRIKTSSLLVAAIHMTTWHSDKMNPDVRLLERSDLKTIMGYLSGGRKTLPDRFRKQPISQMPSIV